MKLNEKSLAKFAMSGASADKEGHLNKRGELNKGFQKRWFLLKGNLLFYFEKRGDKEPIGVIILEQCQIELTEHAVGFVFQIVFPGISSRVYVVSAESQEEMESWMKVLSCASYDYVRLMVKDLQRQLQEHSLESEKKLVEEAERESTILQNYILGETKEQDKSALQLDFERRCSDMLIDVSETNSMKNHLRKKTKSFQEIHEEYGREIIKHTDTWDRTSTPH